jgi:hypothetical protein
MSQKYDVYKDGEGDWAIVPANAQLVAPLVVAAMSGEHVATLADVQRVASAKSHQFSQNQTRVTRQSVIDHFGPYAFVGSIEV